MKLRSGVPIDRAGVIVLELRGNELAGSLGGIVAADSRLRIPFQLVQRGCNGGAVSFPYPIIAPDQGG